MDRHQQSPPDDTTGISALTLFYAVVAVGVFITAVGQLERRGASLATQIGLGLVFVAVCFVREIEAWFSRVLSESDEPHGR